MTPRERFEVLLRTHGRMSFSEFREIRTLLFRVEDAVASVEMELHACDRATDQVIVLGFGGVSGLRLKDFGGGVTQVRGLSIASIADRQWQGLAWEIEDHEDDALHFYCRTIDMTQPPPLSDV